MVVEVAQARVSATVVGPSMDLCARTDVMMEVSAFVDAAVRSVMEFASGIPLAQELQPQGLGKMVEGRRVEGRRVEGRKATVKKEEGKMVEGRRVEAVQARAPATVVGPMVELSVEGMMEVSVFVAAAANILTVNLHSHPPQGKRWWRKNTMTIGNERWKKSSF